MQDPTVDWADAVREVKLDDEIILDDGGVVLEVDEAVSDDVEAVSEDAQGKD